MNPTENKQPEEIKMDPAENKQPEPGPTRDAHREAERLLARQIQSKRPANMAGVNTLLGRSAALSSRRREGFRPAASG